MAIQFHPGKLERAAKFTRASADEGTHTGQKFGNGEGLGQVVIRAGIQSLDALFDKASGRKHQDRRVDPRIAEFAANLDAIQTRKADIQKNAVIAAFGGHLKCALAGADYIDGIRAFTESPADKARNAALVFDDQDSHGAQFSFMFINFKIEI
jgi:hypothetical protein